MIKENNSNALSYWNKYYFEKKSNSIPIPSQFAPFALQEAGNPNLVLEFGCGLGRDSIFFARQGVETIGLDGSHVAVERCQYAAKEFGIENVKFETCQLNSIDLKNISARYKSLITTSKILAYARFFLHAITEDDENLLLNFLQSTLKSSDILAIEYRTTRDADLKKMTEYHYRRYINPVDIHKKLASAGFLISYVAEGFGFAKYGDDDAYAARCIAIKI